MMEQESKELLIKDLCARLPYGVKFDFGYNSPAITLIEISKDGMLNIPDFNVYNCRPYLRPMSSMTEEEKLEREKLRVEVVEHLFVDRLIDFYNSRHLDWRGLIPLNLALEAPEGMYKIE